MFERPCFPPTSSTPSSWPEKLSKRSRTFLFAPLILLSSHCRYSSIIMPVIHFVLLYWYSMRKSFRLIFLKQRGFFDLPIHQTCFFFPPLPACVASVRSGVSF